MRENTNSDKPEQTLTSWSPEQANGMKTCLGSFKISKKTTRENDIEIQKDNSLFSLSGKGAGQEGII